MNPQPNFENRTIYECDNLDVMRGINSETIQLIATDPPFQKGKRFDGAEGSLAGDSSFNDTWDFDNVVYEEWLEAISLVPSAYNFIVACRTIYGDDMAGYLCWLGVRLMEMHRILREDGSIYLHIDHTAHAYVKVLMDAIFGGHNFRNDIVWVYPPGGKPPKRGFHRKHDNILFYSKGDNPVFNRLYGDIPDSTLKTYNRIDSKGRKYKMYRNRRTYLDDIGGRPVPDWWDDIPSFGVAVSSKERTGFPTQKPRALYERMIEASTNAGDVVFDPCYGSGTTLLAAEKLGRRWIGSDILPATRAEVKTALDRFQLSYAGCCQQALISFGDVIFTMVPPARSDEVDSDVPLRLVV